MRDNIFIACNKPWSLSKDVKKEWLVRENNVEWPATDFPFLPPTEEAVALDLTTLPDIWKNLPGFQPIPYEKIGPQKPRSN
jgi:hypothetical protein